MSFLDNLTVSTEEQFIKMLELERFRDVLIDKEGNGTDLYRRLRKEIPSNIPQEIKKIKELIYKSDEYLRTLVIEVLTEEEITPELRKIFLEEILEQMLLMYVGNDEKLNLRRNVIKEAISQKRNRQLEKFDNSELTRVTQMIQDGLQLESVRALGAQLLHDKSKIGEHTRANPQGLYMGTELRRFEILQRLVVDSIIIHRDTSHIDSFIEYLISKGINEKEFHEISNIAIDFHIEKIRRENPGISEQEIYNQIYENYVKNGFLFQGINGAFVESVEEIGLTTTYSSGGTTKLKQIEEIFRAHGVQNVALSKLHERNIDAYYYLTDDFVVGEHFSYHNPEYFSFLTSCGPYYNDDKTFDQLAFYKRDISACLENVRKLCERYGIFGDEQKEVLKHIEEGFSILYPNRNVDKTNGIVVTPKAVVKSASKDIPDRLDRDLSGALEGIIGLNVRNNYSCRIDIPKGAVSVARIAPLQEYFREIEEGTDFSRVKKYINLEDEDMQLYYDVYIKSADPSDLDCILVDEEKEQPELISAKAKEKPLTVDIIRCNPNLGLYDTLDANGENAQPSFQTLMMMIAVNGVANSEKGEELLRRAREEFTPEKMAQYYFFLCNKFLQIAGDKNYVPGIRLTASKRIISDLLPKAIYMSKTGRYPTDVTPNMLLQTQFNFGKSNMLRAQLEEAQVAEYKGKNVSDLKDLIDTSIQYTQHFIAFDQSYFEMCEEWYNELGFESGIKKINKKMIEKSGQSHVE